MDRTGLVVAISSISGGGKSTVVRELVNQLDDAVAIYFDDYETPETYPKSPAAIIGDGADFNEVKSPLLAQHLCSLKNGEPITSPKSGKVVQPAKIIVFEGPLGRAQQETGQYIDFLVFIDTPLEVGLARRFSRSLANADIESMSKDELQKQLKNVQWLADNYLLWMRDAYLAQLQQVRPDSDIILDWQQSPEALASAIIDALAKANLRSGDI
jgi:uridine kinase